MYDVVCLASGGLDSSLCLHLLREHNLRVLPTFVNYGQRGYERELAALSSICKRDGFPAPIEFDVPGFGAVIRSGLTDSGMHVYDDAFTPNRNLFFLILGSALAYSKGVRNLVIGLLAERTTIFPDQTDKFIRASEIAITTSLGATVSVHCPLREFTKSDVVAFAKNRGIEGSYSCHAGEAEPCGRCIACLEYL
jgi:7-cyano-7-deazaguanine synthase